MMLNYVTITVSGKTELLVLTLLITLLPLLIEPCGLASTAKVIYIVSGKK